MNLIKKHIIPFFFYFLGSFLFNWIFIKFIAFWLTNIINKILGMLILEGSIIYIFSEIIVCSLFGFLNACIILGIIDKITENSYIKLLPIIITLCLKTIFWIIHFSNISNVIGTAFDMDSIYTLKLIAMLITPDISFFAMLFIISKSLNINRNN